MLVNVGVFVEHIYKVFVFVCFSNSLLDEKASEVGQPSRAGSNLDGFGPPHWTAAGQEEDY